MEEINLIQNHIDLQRMAEKLEYLLQKILKISIILTNKCKMQKLIIKTNKIKDK
jgi:hypothetical protein